MLVARRAVSAPTLTIFSPPTSPPRALPCSRVLPSTNSGIGSDIIRGCQDVYRMLFTPASSKVVNCALVVRATGAMLYTKKNNGAVGAQWKVLAS
jgi:hypothetical protein